MTFKIGPAWRWLTMKDTSAELAAAQVRELLRQFPMLHVFLVLNVIAVAVSSYGTAPRYLTLDVPAALICCNLARLVFWLNARNRPRNRAGTLKILRRTALISVCFAAVYIAWAIALSVYGGIVGQAQIAVYVLVTIIGFTFCMIHLPQAAVGIAVVTIVPYVMYYFAQGNLQFGVIAIDTFLVTLVMFRVMSTSFRSFRKLVLANEQAERLHGEVSLLAHTDILTGLPNRRLFFSELEKHMDRCNGSQQKLVLGIIDLDRFKTANDTFGHMVGDELLEMVGARLKKVFGRGQLVARLGGDEFAFLLTSGSDDALKIGEEACHLLSAPYKLGKITVHIGASCGVATADEASSSRILYDNADYALYQAKAQSRGTVTLYSLDHEERVKSERAVELALQSADFARELDLHLQPIVDTHTNAIIAVEALARWNNPHLGYVRPDIFIPIAERAGLTHRMTLSLFEKALSYIGLLPTNVSLSFNLSALDLTSEATILALVAMVQRSSIRPSRLYLELTETAAMRDFATAEHSIRILRAIGINISLDDFGTGQSSLSYLHRLPIDKVKLDRSFLMEAGGKSGRDMLGAVVALCHSMNMECVAEGVEDGDQLQFLREIGCDLYQGYHFARPMPVADLLIFLRKHPDQMKLAG